MKNFYILLLLCAGFIHAQQVQGSKPQNEQKSWQRVLEFERVGKIKSAKAIADRIFKRAKRQGNEVQMIKALFYRSKYLNTLEPEAQDNILKEIKGVIPSTSVAGQAILWQMYAQSLRSYYEKNKYKISSRSALQQPDADFKQWSAADFLEKILSAYQKSIEREDLLSKIKLASFEPIFDYTYPQELANRSLFDYLVAEAIGYYVSAIYRYKNREEAFADYKTALLGPSEKFVAASLDSIADADIRRVLQMMQHRERRQSTAFAELDRLTFVYSHIFKSREEHLQQLQSRLGTVRDSVALQKFRVEAAKMYMSLASKNTNPDYFWQAKSLLQKIGSDYKKSYYDARLMLDEIQKKALSVQMEPVIYPGQNTRAHITFRNSSQFTMALYKIDHPTRKLFGQPRMDMDSLYLEIAKRSTPITRHYALPEPSNHFQYTTEVLLPQLSQGLYLAIFKGRENQGKPAPVATQFIQATNIAVLTDVVGDRITYRILDRKTGIPITGALVKTENCQQLTNPKGTAECDYDRTKLGNLIVVKESDTLIISQQYLYEREVRGSSAKVEFFLDRAIYRPGQRVYYKGIAVMNKEGKTPVLANFPVRVEVVDPNFEKVLEFDALTNEFGSFHGDFTLPASGRLGEFHLRAKEPEELPTEQQAHYEQFDELEYSSADFRVEEYKRPKFEVAFLPESQPYKIDSSITIEGRASSFSGADVGSAKVKLTVERAVADPEGYHRHSTVIASVDTITDSTGRFAMTFLASAFEVPDVENPVYYFSVTAEVTDLNGETHDAHKNIRLGYHTLELGINVPHRVVAGGKTPVSLISTNLSGDFKPVKGKLELIRLENSVRKFQPRLFPYPEIAGFTNAEFTRLFPFEDNRLREEYSQVKVLALDVDTGKKKDLSIDLTPYPPGNYKFVFSAPDGDRTIKETRGFWLRNDDRVPLESQAIKVRQLNKNPYRDGYLELELASIVPELFIRTVAIASDSQYFETAVHLKDHKARIRVPMLEGAQSSMKVGFEGVFDNRYFWYEQDFEIPSPVPALSMEVETFRSKMMPGARERWSFRLKSANTPLEAEVLASMYDASLDQFATGHWSSPGFTPGLNLFNRSSMLAKHEATAILQYYGNPYQPVEDDRVKLMWFGFDFANQGDRITQRYLRQLAKKRAATSANYVSGIVSDMTGPIPGANVVVKGTNRGVQSDIDGFYEIEAKVGETLVFSYVGMNDFTQVVPKDRVVNALLEEGLQLSGVVVTGALGIRRTRDAVTSSQQVIVADDNSVTQADSMLALPGRVSGLQISETTGGATRIVLRGNRVGEFNNPLVIIDGQISTLQQLKDLVPNEILSVNVLKGPQAAALYGEKGSAGAIIVNTTKAAAQLADVKARKNLSETVFFFPTLTADKSGRIAISFDAPEALTKWNFRMLAHNKEAVSHLLQASAVTQKDFMVVPNMPRFLREGDTIVISAKIVNLTAKARTGIVSLQLFDAVDMASADLKAQNKNPIQNFAIAAAQNTSVQWKIVVPKGMMGLQAKVVGKAGEFSDGEESILPVLTSDVLVTETIPLWVPAKSKVEVSLANLKSNASPTLRHHALMLEYTSNPVWVALKSLPYLMEYEHECSEQTFARYYANALAEKVMQDNPQLKKVMEVWRKGDVKSTLELAPELKSIILSETPWLDDAKSEAARKRDLAAHFEQGKLASAQKIAVQKLRQLQLPGGAFSWFSGGRENMYITAHILAGLGHLEKLGIAPDTDVKGITYRGVAALDATYSRAAGKQPIIMGIDYLYARSFYLQSDPMPAKLDSVAKSSLMRFSESWLDHSVNGKAKLALIFHRFGHKVAAREIIDHFRETAIVDSTGMYWKENTAGWLWHQSPIENQALLIEAFMEIDNDRKSADAMKAWLLKSRQAKNWPTTKATTEAIYAMLYLGSPWNSDRDRTLIKVGRKEIESENSPAQDPGYIGKTWKPTEISAAMAQVSVDNKNTSPGMGGFYWQYFESIDKIRSHQNAQMSIQKELFLKTNGPAGPVLSKIGAGSRLKIGDLITSRIVVTCKEPVDFVHLKDMRASAFEPVDVLSKYHFQEGVGFYKSTRDAATHYFFDTLPKGTFVFEYDVRVNNAGEFSNGISTIQSMYAPEFSSHSLAVRVSIAP